MATLQSKSRKKKGFRIISRSVNQRALRLCGHLIFWHERNVQHPPIGEVNISRAKFLRVNENREKPRVIVAGYGSIEIPGDFLKPIARRFYLRHNYLPAYLFRDFIFDSGKTSSYPDFPPSAS